MVDSRLERGSIRISPPLGVKEKIPPWLKRGIIRISPLDVKDKIPPWLKGGMSLHRLISFFELLSTYVGVGLWKPDRLCNTDLMWLGIPIVADIREMIAFYKTITIRTDPPIGRYKKWLSVILPTTSR